MPKCLTDVKCCELKIPKFIGDFQTKLKNAKPSLEDSDKEMQGNI